MIVKGCEDVIQILMQESTLYSLEKKCKSFKNIDVLIIFFLCMISYNGVTSFEF